MGKVIESLIVDESDLVKGSPIEEPRLITTYHLKNRSNLSKFDSIIFKSKEGTEIKLK